jgi:hypothetical protein
MYTHTLLALMRRGWPQIHPYLPAWWEEDAHTYTPDCLHEKRSAPVGDTKMSEIRHKKTMSLGMSRISPLLRKLGLGHFGVFLLGFQVLGLLLPPFFSG